ncbi:hypothetical protein [Streptomyces hokutonensis]
MLGVGGWRMRVRQEAGAAVRVYGQAGRAAVGALGPTAGAGGAGRQ